MTDERKALYWLSASGMPANKQNKLLEIFGTAIDIMEALPSEKIREFVGARAYSALMRTRDERVIVEELHAIAKQGIRLLIRGFRGYPVRLLEGNVDPPPVLYVKGNADLLTEPAVSVVGTRRCTDYGRRVANQWSAELASRVVIVSGHATGIDTCAVRSCLACGGSAVVVLACGIDRFDPPEFMKSCPPGSLLLVSEYPLGTHTAKYSYYARNRLLSALSDGVVVVEAARSSGALITANFAAQQNRTVFAVPGDVFSDRSSGTNELIRNGAVAATSVADICFDLGVMYEQDGEKAAIDMTDDERRIYEVLTSGPKHFDEIVSAVGMPPEAISGLLSVMELKGIIEKLAQNRFSIFK